MDIAAVKVLRDWHVENDKAYGVTSHEEVCDWLSKG